MQLGGDGSGGYRDPSGESRRDHIDDIRNGEEEEEEEEEENCTRSTEAQTSRSRRLRKSISTLFSGKQAEELTLEGKEVGQGARQGVSSRRLEEGDIEGFEESGWEHGDHAYSELDFDDMIADLEMASFGGEPLLH